MHDDGVDEDAQGLDEALHQCDTGRGRGGGSSTWPTRWRKRAALEVPLIIAATMPPPRPPTVAPGRAKAER